MLVPATAHLISTFQAVVLGVLQGITELFPISSLGHTVIYPNLFGWHNIVRWQSEANSPWLPFLVMLHVGSAVGLVLYFWRDWVIIVKAFFATLFKRSIETPQERLAWLIIVATIPVGILGIVLQKVVEDAVAKPIYASIFLVVNGLILFAAERFRRSAEVREVARSHGTKRDGGRRLQTLEYREAALIGVAESAALIAGISRDGMTMTAGLLRGLDNEDAARFAFLLAAPPILLAGLLKVKDLTGPMGDGIRGPAVIAAICSALAAIAAVHFLTRWFKTRTLTPFAIYCVVFGIAMIAYNH
jgi:undecaprenyl-diphosphatase